MPDAPLSRRARRAMEARAAERAAAHGDPTQSLGEATGSGQNPAEDTGELRISRRDRRRLERLARPMESWTAEEEMIATGQIPAMTPERLAEQERLAREAAEKAAADAQTASAELRVLAQRDLERGRSAESATPPARVPTADTPVVEPTPQNDPQAPLEERAMVEPYSPRFELDDEGLPFVGAASRSAAIPKDDDPDAKTEGTPAPTSAPEQAGASEQLAAVPEDSLASAEVSESAHSDYAVSEAEAAAARAKVFEELFPPGSFQAALLEHDRQAREAAAAGPDGASSPPQSAAPAAPASADDDEEEERQRGIEEIRRLTQAAINGIERKSQPQAEAQEPDGFSRYEMPTESDGDDGFQLADGPAPLPEWEQPQASPFPTPGSLAPPSGETPTSDAYQRSESTAPHTPSGGLAPHHASFDDALREPSTEIPVRPLNQPNPNHGQVPSPWGSHPLDAAQPSAPRQVADFQPVSDAPRPDFSQLHNRPPQSGQFPTTSGQFPTTSGQFPTTSGLYPTTSGQFPVAPPVTGQIRRAPDLPPVGGAKHFKWLHLAVIGALMFLLGVVIYNVAWGQ